MALLPSSAIPSASGGGYTIDQSLRFNDDDTAYLSKTFSSGDEQKWTFSAWIKRGNLTGSGNSHQIFGTPRDGGEHVSIFFNPVDKFCVEFAGGTEGYRHTTAQYRDTSAWYHFMVATDTTLGDRASRCKLYVNGEQITDFGLDSGPDQNLDTRFNRAIEHGLGRNPFTTTVFDGYMAEVHWVDGTQLTPSSFGETDSTYGHWKPKKVSGLTYGTNGFYLDFSNTSTKHAITASGNAAHKTSRSKIGSSSIEFDGGTDADYLSIPQHSDFGFGTNDWTVEFWVNLSTTGAHHQIGQEDGSDYWRVKSTATAFEVQVEVDGVTQLNFAGSTGLTSTDTWYHMAVVKSDSTATLYLDGTSVGSGSWTGSMSMVDTPLLIGNYKSGSYGLDGFMDEIRISNTARYTTTFTPSTTAFTDDDNTLLLIHSNTSDGSTTFTDSSGVEGSLGNDQSGEDNHFTPTNLTATDQMLDSPTNNFATWNPLLIYYPGYASIFSEGNLKGGHDDNGCVFGSIVMTTGKWYAEMYFEDDAVDHNMAAVFAVATTTTSSNSTIERGISYKDTGDKVVDGTTTSYGATYSTGDIIGIAVDVDAGNVTFYKNNTSQGSTSLGAGDDHVFACGGWNGTWYWVANFGQDSSFAGNKTAQGNQDSNGIGDFYYTPPTDYLALCTSNLPDPTVTPSEHFNTVLYPGSASSQSITDVGFQPDFVWIKGRAYSAVQHALFDAVRGVNKWMIANSTAAEQTTTALTSFNTDGFTVAVQADTNHTSYSPYVAWNWKAGGSGSSNTDGDITSTVSVNQDAGFSIVTYTGSGTGGDTIGHGLSKSPEVTIIKKRSSTEDWICQSETILGHWNQNIRLNTASAKATSTTFVTGVSSSLITLGTSTAVNGSSTTYVNYNFHSVDGYSKVGSYHGNGSANGTFVYTGFTPKYLLLKRTDNAEHWLISDSVQNPLNPITDYLEASTSSDTNTSNFGVDYLSNGFKLRTSDAQQNHSSGTFMYLAFAETPFKHTNAR